MTSEVAVSLVIVHKVANLSDRFICADKENALGRGQVVGKVVMTSLQIPAVGGFCPAFAAIAR